MLSLSVISWIFFLLHKEMIHEITRNNNYRTRGSIFTLSAWV